MENEWSERVFWHVPSGILYHVSVNPISYWAPPPRDATSWRPPYDNGMTVRAIRAQGEPDAGLVDYLQGEDLEEETPALRAVLLAHADEPDCSFGEHNLVYWRRKGRTREEEIHLHDRNPYLRKKRERYAEWFRELEKGGTRVRISEEGIEYVVYNNQPEGAYEEFTRDKQPVHVVDMWLRAGGYNVATMGSLAQANKYLAGVMQNDLSWFNALEYHHAGGAVRCMGPLNTREVHPWLRVALDATTTDVTHHKQRYGKRLLELIRRHNMTTRVTEGFLRVTELSNQTFSKRAVYIWQCGEHIYGLFSDVRDGEKGRFLVYWNARTEEPLRPLTTEDMVQGDRLKFNLLGNHEEMEILDWDQDGFVALVSSSKDDKVFTMLYVRAAPPVFQHTGSKGYIKHRPIQQWLEHHVLWNGKGYATMTTRFICVNGKVLFARGSDNTIRTDRPIQVRGNTLNTTVGGAVAFDTVLVRSVHDDRSSTFYLVHDILAHPNFDTRSWRMLRDDQEVRYYSALISHKRQLGLGYLLCHWKKFENRLVWCDYKAFNQHKRLERASMPQLDLTSAQLHQTICATCGEPATTVDAELGHVLCSAECQGTWYKNH